MRLSVLAIVPAVLLLILWGSQRSIVFPVGAPLQAYGVPGPIAGVELVRVETEDGETLAGYWKAPRPGSPVLVSFHGNGSSPVPHAKRFAAKPWSDGGWGFLAVAYRGYPGSTGSPSEKGLLVDGRAALAFARAKAPDARIFLHGHSLGTAVAVSTAREGGVEALYLEAPFTSLVSVFAGKLPILPWILMRDRFREGDWIASLDIPVRAYHGADDTVVPPDEGRRLAAAARDARFVLVPDADHVTVFRAGDETVAKEFGSMSGKRPDGSTAAN